MVKEVVAINERNGNTIWQDTIQKEMKNVKIAFQTIHECKKIPNKISIHESVSVKILERI